MSSLQVGRTLGDLVLERPSSMQVLARLGIDYCCGGSRSLEEACREQGLDAATVLAFLEHDDDLVAVEATDWTSMPLSQLCDHIVDEHHARIRWDLPRLHELATRTAAVHVKTWPDAQRIADEFEQLRFELELHVDEEERELFPLVAAGLTVDESLLRRLRREHEVVGARLRSLHELAGGYATTAALSRTHRALLEGLHGLELDLHQHVHEENNILFRRARTIDEACLLAPVG